MNTALIIVCALSSKSLASECFDDGNEFCINKDDILSIDLLPGTFIFKEEPSAPTNASASETDRAIGSINSALGEMDYHRTRMNEYLCHGYMAEEIFKEVGSLRKKRLHDLPSDSEFLETDNVTIHDKLLSDEGSSKYKDWLHRTTTLDDIHRHYMPQGKNARKKLAGSNTNNKFDDFDGEITGYAMQAPISPGKAGMYYDPIEEDHVIPAATGHNHHYGFSGPGHYDHHPHISPYPAAHEEHYYFPTEHEYHHKPHKGKDLSIKDFFEIALTALAFLAFKLFIMQLFMNIANANAMTATMAVVTEAARNRFKRSSDDSIPLLYASNQNINELSHRILRSIDAAMVARQDAGNCLRRALCQDNKFSKETKDGRKIWLPFWSLGMSWLSSRILDKTPWSATLQSVKAAISGLGGADCESLYPKCNLQREKLKRRKRRRK